MFLYSSVFSTYKNSEGKIMAENCEKNIYSEDYQDYLLNYFGRGNYLMQKFGTECYQTVSDRIAAVWLPGNIKSNRGLYPELIMPKCYGLMSSDEVLEASGVYSVRRQPALSLYGQGVMVGIIDTGAGV